MKFLEGKIEVSLHKHGRGNSFLETPKAQETKEKMNQTPSKLITFVH